MLYGLFCPNIFQHLTSGKKERLVVNSGNTYIIVLIEMQGLNGASGRVGTPKMIRFAKVLLRNVNVRK